MKIEFDVNYDFTNDTPMFWESYWNDEMGGSFVDPDTKSKMLKKYHRIVWSKKLPNGQEMELKEENNSKYLSWNNFSFGSDSIICSFRYHKYRYMIKEVMSYLPDYKSFMEDYARKIYTIGGSIIFPKLKGSINQARGCNSYIIDRFDLTLECIRRYYNQEASVLSSTFNIEQNKQFLDLFVNFKGYVDYFYLQDLVNEDYTKVKFWLGNGDFIINPFPKSKEEYLEFINKQLDFVEKRNKRIHDSIINSTKKDISF